MVTNIMRAPRVLGEQLAQHVNSDVILLGEVKKVSSNGRNVEMLTTDQIVVNVNLPEPIDGSFEGFVEVHGTAMTKSTISCKSYVHFPPEISNDFESDKYNTFLLTAHVIGDKKWKISSDDEPY